MGEVNITINNRSFKLVCDDGEEIHLKLLAEHLAQHVANLQNTVGKVEDEQLYLMAGLMVCDELWDARDLLLKTEQRLKGKATTQAPVAPDKPEAAPPSTPPSSPGLPVGPTGNVAPSAAGAPPLVQSQPARANPPGQQAPKKT